MSASPAPRRFLGRLAAGLRELTHSAPSQPAPVAAPEPANLFTADELPALADIEAAAAEYDRAAAAARAADRSKRKSKKLLDRLASGRYGSWQVSRVESNRQVADLTEIARIFKAHGLGPVPLRQAAPSLRVERVFTDEAAELLAGGR